MSARVGYVLKRFPRLTQTFVLDELLAHERAGARPVVFSLREPYEGDRHAGYLRLAADVVRVDDAEDLARRADGLGITHLHAHFANAAVDAAKDAAARIGVPHSATLHARDIFRDGVTPGALSLRLEGASFAATVSEYNARWLREMLGAGSAPIEIVRNGLDLRELRYRDARHREPLVLGVGRLVEKKGFDVLIEACGLLRDLGVTFRCEIVGSGPLREALDLRIRELDLGRFVTLAGSVPPSAARERIARAAVLAAPCRVASDGDRDGLPTVLLEAMALGTPCVATAVTAIPEILEDGVTGILAAEGDAGDLARACVRMLGDPDRAAAMAITARRSIEERYDADRNAAELRNLWERAA